MRTYVVVRFFRVLIHCKAPRTVNDIEAIQIKFIIIIITIIIVIIIIIISISSQEKDCALKI